MTPSGETSATIWRIEFEPMSIAATRRWPAATPPRGASRAREMADDMLQYMGRRAGAPFVQAKGWPRAPLRASRKFDRHTAAPRVAPLVQRARDADEARRVDQIDGAKVEADNADLLGERGDEAIGVVSGIVGQQSRDINRRGELMRFGEDFPVHHTRIPVLSGLRSSPSGVTAIGDETSRRGNADRRTAESPRWR